MMRFPHERTENVLTVSVRPRRARPVASLRPHLPRAGREREVVRPMPLHPLLTRLPRLSPYDRYLPNELLHWRRSADRSPFPGRGRTCIKARPPTHFTLSHVDVAAIGARR